MIYNTTLSGGAGGVWTDANGKPLIAIGNQNLYAGKNVWTDGHIIYGYDVPSFMPRKINAKKEKVITEIITYIHDGSSYSGYFSGVEYYKPKEYTDAYNYHVLSGRLTVPQNTAWALAAGNKLYYIIENNNTITIGDVNGEEVTINDTWNSRFFGAAGANGGIIITGGSSSGYSGDIVYISPDMREYRVYSSSGTGTNWTLINAVGHFDVNNEGEATCTVSVTVVNDYDEKTEIKTLKFNSYGGNQMINYTDPVLGDGIGHFERSGNTVSNNGTITFEFEEGEHRTLTLPITNGYTSSVVGDYVFIYSVKRIGVGQYDIKQYDKSGNLLRDYGTGSGRITRFNNFKLIGCDPVKMFRQWGFVEN